MSSTGNSPAAKPTKTAPLSRALDQSELVQGKVQRAGSDLASVNAVLKDDVSVVTPAKVAVALEKSEAIETKVQEAAEELGAVNAALGEEIGERQVLEERLSRSTTDLAVSRSDESKSRHNSLHDPLTGVPNLTLFMDRLRNAIAQAKRHAWRLAVMFIDLDEFKAINDTHGHDAGDQVLHMVAQRLLGFVRAGDTVSRRSGDEFLVLMLEARDQANVAAFAAKVSANIGEPSEIDGTKFSMKASIGIALYPEDGQSAEELLKHADRAMYAAKQKKAGPMFYGAIAAKISAARPG